MQISKLRRTIMILSAAMSVPTVSASERQKSGVEIVPWKGNIYDNCTFLSEQLNETKKKLHRQDLEINSLTKLATSLATDVLEETKKNKKLANIGQSMQVTMLTNLSCTIPALKELGPAGFAEDLKKWNNPDLKKKLETEKSRLDELYEKSEEECKKAMEANEEYQKKVENKAKERPDIFRQLLSDRTEKVNKLKTENKNLDSIIKHLRQNNNNNLNLVKSLPELETYLRLANEEGQEELNKQEEEIKFSERCIMEFESKLSAEKKRGKKLLEINCNMREKILETKALPHTKRMPNQKEEMIKMKAQNDMKKQADVYNGIETSKECACMFIEEVQAINENKRKKEEIKDLMDNKKGKEKVDEFLAVD
jgi:DNA repair exonuclease SbcCD ATPase subunit